MFSDELEILEYQHRLRPNDDTMWDNPACPICHLTENCQCDSQDTRAVTRTARARYED